MPSLGEVQNDPAAYQEALVAARKLPKGHLCEVARVQKKESEDATMALRQNWQRWWDLWQNEVVFDGKEEWQSQVWVAKPFTAVEQASSQIRRSLLDSPEFFGVQGTDDWDKILAAHLWKPLLKLLLDKAGFVDKFSDATKVGFIMGVAGYLKFRWATTHVPTLAGAQVDQATGQILPSFRYRPKSVLAIDYVLPWNIFRDPDSQARENFSGSYLWHAEFKSNAVLAAMAQMGWDQEAVTRLLAKGDQGRGNDETQTAGRRREYERKQLGYWERHRFRKDYPVDEGWLDLPGLNGEIVLPNALLIVSGEEVLYGPCENPIWATDMNTGRRKWPFVAGAPIAHPSRFEGRGILEQDEGLSWLFSNTFNLFADAMNWEVNPDYEVFEQGLVEWDDLSRYPGKPWAKNTPQQVLMPAKIGQVNIPGILAFLNYLDQQRENTNFVTQFVQGAPATRDVTARETSIKTNQSLGQFEGMGRNLEAGGRVAIELAYDMCLQFMAGNDFTDPSVISILGPEAAALAATWDLKTRIDQMQGNFDFTFTGVSQAMAKADQLQNAMQFATLSETGRFPAFTKPWQILRVVAELLNLSDRIDIGEPAAPAPGMLPGEAAAPGQQPPVPQGQAPQPPAAGTETPNSAPSDLG